MESGVSGNPLICLCGCCSYLFLCGFSAVYLGFSAVSLSSNNHRKAIEKGHGKTIEKPQRRETDGPPLAL
jgi:hypothetical protein